MVLRRSHGLGMACELLRGNGNPSLSGAEWRSADPHPGRFRSCVMARLERQRFLVVLCRSLSGAGSSSTTTYLHPGSVYDICERHLYLSAAERYSGRPVGLLGPRIRGTGDVLYDLDGSG